MQTSNVPHINQFQMQIQQHVIPSREEEEVYRLAVCQTVTV